VSVEHQSAGQSDGGTKSETAEKVGESPLGASKNTKKCVKACRRPRQRPRATVVSGKHRETKVCAKEVYSEYKGDIYSNLSLGLAVML